MMDRRGCAVGFAVGLILPIAVGVWLNFALAIERERAGSADGLWIATTYIDGTPLTAENERVHVWRWWQPHLRWLGCQVLEAKNESPTRLLWEGGRLQVQHGFRPNEIVSFRRSCGPLQVSFERQFDPY